MAPYASTVEGEGEGERQGRCISIGAGVSRGRGRGRGGGASLGYYPDLVRAKPQTAVKEPLLANKLARVACDALPTPSTRNISDSLHPLPAHACLQE